MKDLTRRESDLLRYIFQWHKENVESIPVDRGWIEKRMGVEKSGVSGLKRRLINKGFLIDDKYNFTLSSKASAYIANSTSQFHINTPTYLPLLGQVKAGRTKQDEVEVYMNALSDSQLDSIPIPVFTENANAFVLEVIGESMENEGIYSGDYVIVQPYVNSQFPRQRDLIVTRYLPPANESETDGLTNLDETLLEGPTVKYFTDIPGQKRPYRLSWRRNIDQRYHLNTSGRDYGVAQEAPRLAVFARSVMRSASAGSCGCPDRRSRM